MSKYNEYVSNADEDYYNMNDIMATRTNIACTFKQGTPSEFFRLVGQQPPESITEKGYKTETPSWMMCTLAGNLIDYKPDLPKAFTDTTRNSLLAGPEGKNLESLSLHYYTFGMRLAALLKGKTGQDIAASIMRIFEKRTGWILKLSVNPVYKPTLLDYTEKRIFLKAQKSEIKTENWFHRNNENLKPSRKRSHAELV